MPPPWTAEASVTPESAQSLIETQFPELAPARIEPLGVGWDNTAFVANGEWVFRFPRRRIAVELLETETRLLPAIAERLPLPVPRPTKLGRSDGRYPWPFAGYRRLPGRTLVAANLSAAQRAQAAAPLAEFLAALHAIPLEAVRACDVPPDQLRRLDISYRTPQILERLEQLVQKNLLTDLGPYLEILEQTPRDRPAGAATLVHGDLHAGQLLADDAGRLAGVIDWGDAHRGEPGVDLAIAHGLLPPAAHETFRHRYGPITEDAWRIARFRALQISATLALYGHETGNAELLREARTALQYLRS